ncbi:MAG: hypothetical protein ACK5Z2_20750 [Bacteroidota bacterium]|jgi:hypothetical protein
MEYYYNEQIKLLVQPCPPKNYRQYNKKVFRWVFDSMEDEKNFKAQAEKNPPVLNDKTDKEKCEYYALSFHSTIEASREAFVHLKKIMKNAHKRLGTNIASGKLLHDDGLGSDPDANGHINFHHYKQCNFVTRFTITEKL